MAGERIKEKLHHHHHDEGKHDDLNASAAALDHITNTAAQNHDDDPKNHIHQPAIHESSTSFLCKFFPSSYLEALENSYHLGNYVIDRQTGEKSFEAMSIYVRVGMHMLYYGSQQERVLHWDRVKSILKAQSLKMGATYDAPESVAHIQPFIDSFGLASSMPEMVQPDPTKYATFNEFFAREIRPDARPPAEPENAAVVSSPADCRLTTFPTVDMATKYWIKGKGFTIAKLLANDELAKEFDGGSIMIARLAPQDYHRWHAPVSGTVVETYDMAGSYYTVNPQAINESGTMDVFCENRRSVMLVDRAGTGRKIAIVAVGAMLVGSIKYAKAFSKAGAEFKRGECLGAFYYGGSTVIVLFPKGEVNFDEDLVRNSTEKDCETLVKVGWRVGTKP